MVLCNHRPKACPERGGGFRVSESRRGYKLARSSLLVSTPQSRLTPCQLPVRGAFWFVQPPTQKPALKGEVAMSDSELTEGLHRSCSFFPSTPQSPVGDSSPSGEPFSTVQAHCTVPYPSRSDRFNGVTGGAGGPKGRNRNLPWPPCKKGYKDAYLLFICLNPSVNS